MVNEKAGKKETGNEEKETRNGASTALGENQLSQPPLGYYPRARSGTWLIWEMLEEN